MIIIKVKRIINEQAEFIDILVENNKNKLFFILNMLEENNEVVSYEILFSTMTTFDVTSPMVFNNDQFPKYQKPHVY